MEDANALGEFLRAKRGQVLPEDVGLTVTGYRRVTGLRREEVATLAGISQDYYLRLEQGRDQNPSVQVLDALADVLQLDEDATAYLHGLSRPTSRRIQRRRTEQVPTGIVQLLQTLPMPAFVQNRYMDVLAANPVAEALSPNMRPGVNRLRAAFLDPRDRELHRDWEAATVAVVAQLRSVVGPETDDPRLAELIGEVSMKSDRFRRLWARHDVRHGEGTTSLLHHAEVGDLDLRREKLAIPGTDGQLLVIYHATPGTGAEQALALLGSLAASKNVRSGDDAEMNSRREQPRNR